MKIEVECPKCKHTFFITIDDSDLIPYIEECKAEWD